MFHLINPESLKVFKNLSDFFPGKQRSGLPKAGLRSQESSIVARGLPFHFRWTRKKTAGCCFLLGKGASQK